jgi:uncharacterized peroxidase-related enzyme
MARFPSLPDRPVLGDVFKRFPQGIAPLLEYHDVLLRGPSPLSVAQRELIAAYVSGLNACRYCYGAHRTIAEIHGVPPSAMEGLLDGPAPAHVEPALLPILAYVKKLTEQPSRMTDADAQAVYAAGWDEQALFHAICVCAIFNFMNRVVEGCGVQTDAQVLAGQRVRHTALKDDPQAYQSFGRALGIVR